MKKLFCSIALLLAATALMAQKEVPQVANIMARQITSLNGEWNYIMDL